jgi:hypothetical protein
MREDEPIEELGISTWDRLRDAVEAGDKETTLLLIEYLQDEGKGLHDAYVDWTYALLSWIANHAGEEKLIDVFKETQAAAAVALYSQMQGLKTPRQLVAWQAEQMRAHRSGPKESGNITVREEEDRYVLSFDPCGSGGRIRRTGELDKTPPRTGPPLNLGVTKKPYPWSWCMENVPYYCLHCCIWHEIVPIEAGKAPYPTGYSPDPNNPCAMYFYKDPDKIPEEYYQKVGKEKPKPSKK